MTLAVIDAFPAFVLESTRDVSGLSSRSPVRLTLSGFADSDADNAGRLVFLRDIDATFAPVERSALWRRRDADGVTGGYLRWFRVEIQAPAGKGAEITAGMEAVWARDHGTGWFAALRFKGANHKSKVERVDPLREPCATGEEAIQRLEALSWDYWESGKFVTAGISIPPESCLDVERNYTRGQWLFGVCESVEQSVAALRLDPEVRKLQRLTDNRSLQFWPRSAGITVPEVYCRFHDELAEHATLLLELALKQALAGPEDGVEWQGRPVAELVAMIYKNHMYRVNRQLVDRDQNVREFVGGCNGALERERRRQGMSVRGGGE